jgi:FMN phosphatase YigB (HAD superfamily)
VHVGDDLRTDIRGGHEAGLAATIWVNASGRPLPEGSTTPTFTVAHVSEVYRILKDLVPHGRG